MTGNLRHINNVMGRNDFVNSNVRSSVKDARRATVAEDDLPLVHESCKCSTFSLAVGISGLLVFAGIILYALLV